MFCIYAHIWNSKIVYIGQGKKKRLSRAHYANPTYSAAWKSFFKNKTPKVEVLKDNIVDEETADFYESLAILEFTPCLNAKHGGRRGKYIKVFKKSDETKRKMSLWQKGRSRPSTWSTHGMTGKSHSFHSLAQNAASNGAVPFYARKIETGDVFGPFYFRRQASEKLNIPYSANISSCLTGRLKHYKGYSFERAR